MHSYLVKYYVQEVGQIEETVSAASEYQVRRLVEAKYPEVYVRVVQVTQLD